LRVSLGVFGSLLMSSLQEFAHLTEQCIISCHRQTPYLSPEIKKSRGPAQISFC
jgi:hypothetical protein